MVQAVSQHGRTVERVAQGSHGAHIADSGVVSDTKCESSALNNDITVKSSTLQDVRQRKRQKSWQRQSQ